MGGNYYDNDSLDIPDVAVTFEEESPFTDTGKSELFFSEKTKVWIGDPCYAPELSSDDDETWQEFCSFYFDAGGDNEGFLIAEHRGVEFLVGGTAHGDGCYELNIGGHCGVDAGLLSVIPAGAFGLDPDSGDDYGGNFVEIDGRCYMDEYHTFHAGSVNVITEDRCECCNSIDGTCGCERCWDCGEWEEYCTCSEDRCESCGECSDDCTCEEDC